MAKRKVSHDKYRSGFEAFLAKDLTKRKVKFEYETVKLPFTQPAKERNYVPDFIIKKPRDKTIIIEAKGRLTVYDRQKMQWVKEHHPEEDIRIVFQRDNPIRKGSNVTYSKWAEKVGYKCAVGSIPKDWV